MITAYSREPPYDIHIRLANNDMDYVYPSLPSHSPEEPQKILERQKTI